MKVIFHRYGSIVEPDILQVFHEFNIDVVEDAMEITEKQIDGERRLRTMAELILGNSPEFVFSINYFPYISEICEKLHTKYVALSVDCPVLEIYDRSVRNSCNRLFLFDYNQYETIRDENPDNIYYLPLGTNMSRWNSLLGELKTPENLADIKYNYDVSLVGSLYTEKSILRGMKLNEFDIGYAEGLIRSQMTMPGLGLLEEMFRTHDPKAVKNEAVNITNPREDDKSASSNIMKLSDHMREAAPDFFEKYSLENGLIDVEPYVIVQNVLGFEISARERVSLLKSLGNAGLDTHIFTRSPGVELGGAGVKVHGGVSTHEEMPRIFRTSKFNLNPTMRGIQTGIPQRVWDVLGCGGLCLCNYQSEIPEYLEIGEDILCYESESEALDLIRYYLDHEDQRLIIAYNGYTKVKAFHDVKIRVTQMLKKVLEERD